MSEAEDLYSSYIVNCVFNAILCYTAIMFNSVSIHAIRRTSSLPKPLKALLLSLAVSDLCVGLIVQPLYVAVLVMLLQQNTENNPIYRTTSLVYHITINLFAYASFFSVTALTADRFLAVHLHLRYQEFVTLRRVVGAVISIWVCTVFFSLMVGFRLIPRNVAFYASCASIEIACFIIMAVLYYKIYSAVRRHANDIQALQIQQAAQNDQNGEIRARVRKSAVATFYVYLFFFVCYLPNTLIYLAVIINSGPSTVILGLSTYAVTLVLLNSSLNPLIYCWKMKHIRHAILDTLRIMLPSSN